MSANITQSQFNNYLLSQEDTYVHFEYENEIYYVLYGPNREEAVRNNSIGKGKNIAEAIYDLTEKFFAGFGGAYNGS